MEKLTLGKAEQSIDFKRMHDESLVNLTDQIKRQPVAISIGDHAYAGNIYPTPFGSYGDFSCIVGASKSKKTFFKSALIAGYIGGQSTSYFPSIKGHDTQGKFVLDVDTEQSKFHTQRVVKRVCSMVGANPEFYKGFSLRKESARIRFQFIEWLMMESEYRDNVGLITVDGSADLLENVNDLEESNRIVQGMMKWTSESQAHLITVLHRNHGTMKPTGHLGSAILKKSETVAFVEKQDDHVKVSPEYTRNVSFEEFNFIVDSNSLPKETGGFEWN